MELIHETYYIKVNQKENGNLEIIPKPEKIDEMKKDCRDFYSIMEDFICDTSFRWIGKPGLTEMPTMGIVSVENENGEPIGCSELYGFNNYMVRNPYEELTKGNPIIMKKFV